jgi:hypothetical protein
MITAVLSVLVVVISLAVKLVGYTEQIIRNAQRKSTEGLSVSFNGLSLGSYGAYAWLGFLLHSWAICLAQGIGVPLVATIICQMIVYRRRMPERTGPEGDRRAAGSGRVVAISLAGAAMVVVLPRRLALPAGTPVLARLVDQGVLLRAGESREFEPNA